VDGGPLVWVADDHLGVIVIAGACPLRHGAEEKDAMVAFVPSRSELTTAMTTTQTTTRHHQHYAKAGRGAA
jgi:hypothetical protein